MLISPKTNPFSIDSLLGIKDAETSRDNKQTGTPVFETEYNSKDKTVNEKDTEFKSLAPNPLKVGISSNLLKNKTFWKDALQKYVNNEKIKC